MIQFKVQNAKAILYSVFFNISFISFINHLYRWYRSWLLIANDNLCFIYFKKKKKKRKFFHLLRGWGGRVFLQTIPLIGWSFSRWAKRKKKIIMTRFCILSSPRACKPNRRNHSTSTQLEFQWNQNGNRNSVTKHPTNFKGYPRICSTISENRNQFRKTSEKKIHKEAAEDPKKGRLTLFVLNFNKFHL